MIKDGQRSPVGMFVTITTGKIVKEAVNMMAFNMETNYD
jgi:hypothetical protein